MHYIDYSQYSAWLKCQWLWIEREVLKRRLRYLAQRDDALALGSLVHAGLEMWHKTGAPGIAQEVIAQLGPTPECLALAQQLVVGYVQRYPHEAWKVTAVEAPVTFSIGLDNYMGVAKLDGYFYVPEQMLVEDGIGTMLTLAPGWYSLEHKTRDMGVDRGLWMRKWEVNMQASFQCLALEGLLQRPPVQGVLINVLDKPRQHTPKRKCKTCGESSDLVVWEATATPKEFKCPLCGATQELSEYKPKGPPKQPEYWRMLITRNALQLERDRYLIRRTAEKMLGVRNLVEVHGEEGGFTHCQPNREECVNPWQRRECEFFRPHTYNFTTAGHPDYEEPEDYLGLSKLVQIQEVAKA